MLARTQFPPEPRSVAAARHWVRDSLLALDRSDLVPSAEAGVSELVTNGLLHAQTSIGLQLTGSRDRVIVEVYDGSPEVAQSVAEVRGSLDSTIGRGLRIVRAHAREWGVATTGHGKAIWFAPRSSDEMEPRRPAGTTRDDVQQGTDLIHSPADLDRAIDALVAVLPDMDPTAAGYPSADGLDHAPAQHHPGDSVTIHLLAVPSGVVHHYRKRWLELLREMHLVAMGEPSEQQRVAQGFCKAEQAVHPYLYLIERAENGRPTPADDGSVVDAIIVVPRSMREAFSEIRDMARDLETRWAGIQLLFVHPGKQAVQLREWWLGEVVGQLDGGEPTPWPGDLWVRDEAMLSAREA